MDYSGPDAADYADVAALNEAFLICLRAPAGAALRDRLPERLQPVIAALRDVQVERLARTPFLLLSLRERDAGYWRRLAGQEQEPDLFAAGRNGGDHVATAALSFLWHLARRNPYALRLVAGAGNDCCSILMDSTLLALLRRAASRADFLLPREAGNVEFWGKLLGPGLSSDPTLRAAAHTACLQTMLTDMPESVPMLRAAARRSQPPRYRTAAVQRPG
jgi:hypothetical protein